MKVYTVSNSKGGIAKSSTATALAAVLTEKGKKVLLIDADPQGNSTDTYRAETNGVATLYDVILDGDPLTMNEVIQHTDMGDIVASDKLLGDADKILSGDVSGMYRMADAISELKGYDYVIIDTAPALNILLFNCLIASDGVIIPVTTDRYSLQGLSQLNTSIREIQRRQNPRLVIEGLLISRCKMQMKISKEFRGLLDGVAEQMNTKVFGTAIRECVKVREAQARKMSILDYAPDCTAAADYRAFTEELTGGNE